MLHVTNGDSVIEGFKEFEAIRDFLYTRMRGYQAARQRSASDAGIGTNRASAPVGSASPGTNQDAEMVSLLLNIRDEVQRTRELLESAQREIPNTPAPPTDV